jgi:hypothetical protein
LGIIGGAYDFSAFRGPQPNVIAYPISRSIIIPKPCPKWDFLNFGLLENNFLANLMGDEDVVDYNNHGHEQVDWPLGWEGVDYISPE